MALAAGTRLGPYEILEPLGAGGMGEVYRARDTRLDRTVAVKVLPAELAADPQLKARFEREARAISALAHPNICTLHDVGEQDGRTFLVMEHLVGQTLAERLKKGPLPPEQALEIATQIADALSAAHKQGIVHRDLKPGNVMLTKTSARLLDFGLARLTGHGAQPAVESLTSAPTEPEPLTGRGTVMGTLPYMAPEQVEGKPADGRTDLWALGTILYEMVTGHRAFQASSPVSLVGAILEREPRPLADHQPLTPSSLDRLVRRCLAKDPDERWDTAHDVAVRLREIAESGPETLPPRGTPRWLVPSLGAAVVGAVLAGILTGWMWRGHAEGRREAKVVRSHIDLTPDRPLRGSLSLRSGLVHSELALSPDGTLLVWSSRTSDEGSSSVLHHRRLDTGEVTRLPGTEGASQPFFSPDGRWIGFFAWESRGRYWLRKVPAEGGLVVDLASLPSEMVGASWGQDGRILLGSWNQGVQALPAEGGSLSEITTVDPASEAGHRLPRLLPGGQTLLVTTVPTRFGGKARVIAFSLATGDRKVLIADGADARYLPTGHLLFARRGVLMAAPFDPAELEMTAPPIPVVEGVLQRSDGEGSEAVQLAVSDSGVLAYVEGPPLTGLHIDSVLVDEAGRTEPLPGFDKTFISPQFQFSPDGRQLAFVEQSPGGLLWLFDVERQTYRALSKAGIAGSPRWSPDGSHLVMTWSEAGPLHLWMVPTRPGERERLTEGEAHDWSPSWSPDGRFLAFIRAGATSWDIFVYRFEDRQIVPFLTSRAREQWPEFSPDGRWLAYTSDESGRPEVYVTSFPDQERTLTVSRRGGRAPAWSRDGRRLYYYSVRAPERPLSMMAVTVGPGPELSLGPPTALFALPQGFVSLGLARSYDLHPDGRRFVVGVRRDQERTAPITRLTLVYNWFAELNRLAPTE